MLRFTAEQQAVVLNSRRAFAANMALMSQNYGDTLNGRFAVGNASPLPRDVWGDWDREGVEVQRDVLSVFNDLAASVQTPMPIGKLVHFFQTVSDSGGVNISLDGRSKSKTDQQVINYHGTPLPILDSTFSYGWRQWAAAATEGYALDPAGRRNSNRRVAEKAESLVLDGDPNITVGSDQLYGLRTHPNRNTRATGVTLNGATGAQWVAEVVALLELLHGDEFRQPATLYLNWDDWFYAGSNDFSTQYPNKTILQRIMEIPGVGQIVPASRVDASQMIAVIKNREVVQVLSAMPMNTTALFRANPTDDYNFITMMAAALEIKFDATDNCGVAVSTLP